MRSALPALGFALLAFGCGGSSSETPPPLEPDPTSSRYTGPAFPAADEERAPPPAADPDALDAQPEQQGRPARATWGSGKPSPAPSAGRMP